jgi:hypothetical protein
MIRRIYCALPAMLAAAALLAGCGSSTSGSGSAATNGSTTATGAAKIPAVASAGERCKRGAGVLPTLPQATKRRLESICQKAADDPKAARAAAREACEAIVNSSPLPAGAARGRALSECRSAGGK